MRFRCRLGYNGRRSNAQSAYMKEGDMGRLADVASRFHGIEIDEEQERLLMADLHAVMRINETMNLTRILSEEGGVVLHLEDSLTGLPFVEQAPAGAYADLGTGGGFPGIPLCIMTGRNTLLVDSVQKKVRALKGVAEELGLAENVDIYAGRFGPGARAPRAIRRSDGAGFKLSRVASRTCIASSAERRPPCVLQGAAFRRGGGRGARHSGHRGDDA